jgi:hypothetical protein
LLALASNPFDVAGLVSLPLADDYLDINPIIGIKSLSVQQHALMKRAAALAGSAGDAV